MAILKGLSRTTVVRLTRARLWFSPLFLSVYPFSCAHSRGAGIRRETKFRSHVPSDVVRIKAQRCQQIQRLSEPGL